MTFPAMISEETTIPTRPPLCRCGARAVALLTFTGSKASRSRERVCVPHAKSWQARSKGANWGVEVTW